MTNNVPYINHFQYNYYNNGLNYNNYQHYYTNYPNYNINYTNHINYNQNSNDSHNPIYVNNNNYYNGNRYNNRYKKSTKYTPKTIECGVCNIFFKSTWQLEEHINDTHIKCSFEDCTFNGPLEIVEIHKLKHIKNENGESLIDSREETIKWINSRKVNFPKSNTSNGVTNCSNDSYISTHPNNTSERSPETNMNMIDDENNGLDRPGSTLSKSKEIRVKNDQSMLEIYLRNNMNKKTVIKKRTKSIICPLLNKIYKQPSALIRYTNPFKYEHLLRKMETFKTPYSFKSSIIEKYTQNTSRIKDSTQSEGIDNTHQSKGLNKIKRSYSKKYTVYSIPKRPPVYLELIRSDVEKLDGLVVEIIKTIQILSFKDGSYEPSDRPIGGQLTDNIQQYLKSNEKCVNIKRYSGCVAAVDAMCWIHRSMVSSAVANVRGEMSDKFLKFIISMLSLLLSYNITPIMVFDGYEMPAKKAENAMRRERREKAKKEALEMIEKNKNKINTEIMKKCMQAIHITPEIIYRVISVCRKINVAVIVSPFEADAQISYLCRSGVADFAISEDSDLVVYGCPKIIYKLDKEGRGVELNVPFNSFKVSAGPRGRKGGSNTQVVKSDKGEDPHSEANEDVKTEDANHDNESNSSNEDCNQANEGNQNDDGSANGKSGDHGDYKIENKVKDGIFKGLNHRMFVVMCVLSGTDYDDGYHINGMGLKVAYRLVLEHENLSKVLRSVYDDAKWANKLSEYKFKDILLHYENVCKIFLHNIVFDPKRHQLIHINPISNLDNTATSKLELLSQKVEEYKFIYDMSSFLINKNVNFINVAKGLISVADDMEIDYVLTEYDLTVIETITNKIKFDLYRLPSTFNRLQSVTNDSNATVSTITTKGATATKSPDKSPTKGSARSATKSAASSKSKTKSDKSSTTNNKVTGSTSKSATKAYSKSTEKSPRGATTKRQLSNNVGAYAVKSELTNNGTTNGTNSTTSAPKSKSRVKSEGKPRQNGKRAVKNLLNNTETYTVKRSKR